MNSTIEERLRADLSAIAASIVTTPRVPEVSSRRTTRRRFMVGGLLAITAIGGSAAIAATVLSRAPAGVSSEPGGDPTKPATPSYLVNARGQTYGDPGDDILPKDYPDLLAVVATNGAAGYVERASLDELTGANVSTPADALAWQERQSERGVDTLFLPVVESDGVTPVGVFPVTSSQSFEP